MYIPENLELHDKKVISEFINEFGFGLLVSPTLDAAHLPLVYQAEENRHGSLYGHLAKANSLWHDLEGQRVLVVFSGPHAYISPTWYVNKPAVPTWNYAAVHCYGTFEVLNELDTAESMNALVSKYEPALHDNTALMPEEYKQKLAQGVIGFRIAIDAIQAKEKLGQRRKPEDQVGVFTGLAESSHPDSNALARYMKKRNLGMGTEE